MQFSFDKFIVLFPSDSVLVDNRPSIKASNTPMTMARPSAHKTKKRFGQHFLHEQQIISQIVNAVQLTEQQVLLEIGPGQGAITIPLLQKYKRLTAIELDRDLIKPLSKEAILHGDLTLINADVLNIDFNALFSGQSLSIVGNLPYNISTPLLFHLLAFSNIIASMTFMVQQEVANRITADVGHKNYGRLSIMMQYHCASSYLFHVPPESFSPPPKVDSAVIHLLPHKQLQTTLKDKTLLDKIVKIAFSQRRKTIRNSLSSLLTSKQFEISGINSKLRAENLSLADYISLTNTVHDNA